MSEGPWSSPTCSASAFTSPSSFQARTAHGSVSCFTTRRQLDHGLVGSGLPDAGEGASSVGPSRQLTGLNSTRSPTGTPEASPRVTLDILIHLAPLRRVVEYHLDRGTKFKKVWTEPYFERRRDRWNRWERAVTRLSEWFDGPA